MFSNPLKRINALRRAENFYSPIVSVPAIVSISYPFNVKRKGDIFLKMVTVCCAFWLP